MSTWEKDIGQILHAWFTVCKGMLGNQKNKDSGSYQPDQVSTSLEKQPLGR